MKLIQFDETRYAEDKAIVCDQLAPPFRGTIADNARRFRLSSMSQKAMPPEQDGYFRLETARQLAGPLRALQDPAVEIVIIIGAVQVLKSVAGEIWSVHVFEHDNASMLVLFEDDKKAAEFALFRLMDLIRHHPALNASITEVEEAGGNERHKITGTRIKLPGRELLIGGMNEGNCSTLSWQFIWISEAWQHGADGSLQKAIKRADRFVGRRKVFIESQAGMAGEDLEMEVRKAHRCDLTWACPFCGGRQTWVTTNEFGTLRPEDFQPLPRLFNDDGQAPATPKPGTYAGMKFHPPEMTVDGVLKGLTIEDRARSAWWECYHCGSAIHDTAEMRRALSDSYEQDYQIAGPGGRKRSPNAVVFYLPFEAAWNNLFRQTVAKYLSAKDAARMGDKIPLRDWYLQDRAVTYSESITKATTPVVTGSYHVTPDQKLPDELCRVLAADAQQDDALTTITGRPTTGHFWVVVRAITKPGDMFQLWRGYVTSWDDLIQVQERFQVSNENVGIDASFFTQDITDKAAQTIQEYKRAVKKHGKWRDATIWHTWTLLKGDDRGSWKHADGHYRSFSPMQPQFRRVNLKGSEVEVKIPLYQWSNVNIKDQLATLVRGNTGQPDAPQVVRFEALPRSGLDEATRLREHGELTYENQMSAEFKTMRKNGKPIWEKVRRHNHYWDCENMALVLLGLGGYLGVSAPADEETNDV